MRGAFIVQLGTETNPAEGRFDGWVQEVDFCRELRFHSSEELLKFLGERFEVAKAVAEKTRTLKKCGTQPRRKRPGKEKP